MIDKLQLAALGAEMADKQEPMCMAKQIEQLRGQLGLAIEVIKDHDRLVRELDVLLNGEKGAAKQASLCDLVSRVAKASNGDALLAGQWQESIERSRVELGVVEFHTAQNIALRDQFYMVTDDLKAAACIVDVWLMDIASVLKSHGYSMEIYRCAAPNPGGQS